MDEPFKFRRVKEITGAFVLIILILVLGAVYLSGRLQEWFAPTYRFKIVLPQEGAFGLSEGSEVQVMGVTAGWIDDIRVENGQLVAIAKIEGEFRDLIRIDSSAQLQRTFMLAGETYLEIERGAGPTLTEEAVIVAQAPRDFIGEIEELVVGLDQDVQPVLKQAREAMTEWTRLAADLRQSQARLSNVVARSDRVMARVEMGKGTIGRVISDEQMAKDLNQIVEEAKIAVTELRGALDNIQQGTARLPEIGDTLASEASDLPMLTLQAQQTLQEIQNFFEGLQRHWFFRGAMQTEDPPPRIPPTQVEGGRR